MNRRGVVLAVALVALVAAMLVRHPTADIRVFAHDPADIAPRKVEAAVDLGVLALSLIVTWSARRLSV